MKRVPSTDSIDNNFVIKRLKSRIDNLDNIINEASDLLEQYNSMQNKYGVDYFTSASHENRAVYKRKHKDTSRYKGKKLYIDNTGSEETDIKPFDNKELDDLRHRKDNQKLFEKLEYFLQYPLRTLKINELISSNVELSDLKSSEDRIKYVKISQNLYPLENKPKILNILKGWSNEYSKIKSYPYISIIVPNNEQFDLRSKSLLSAYNIVVNYIKGKKGKGYVHARLSKRQKNRNAPKGSQTSKKKKRNQNIKNKLNNEKLRGGCSNGSKAAIRKCYKALKETTKETCRIYNCKSGFKSSFKSNCKSACLYEFSDDYGSSSSSNKTKLSQMSCSKKKKSKSLRNSKEISNRVNCVHLPESSLRDIKMGNITLNVLRDKYQKAWDNDLYKKCKNACTCAIETTCAEYECINKKIKRLKKDCNAQCKSKFKPGDSSESSEYSESSEEVSEEYSDSYDFSE